MLLELLQNSLGDALPKGNALPVLRESLDSRSLRQQELLPAQGVLAGVVPAMLLGPEQT